MIRRSSHTLKFATDSKKQKLDELFEEYTRLVNKFIGVLWNYDQIPSKANTSLYHQVDSYLINGVKRCAANQAIGIIKSVRKKNRNKIYKAYQKVYSKACKKNRNIKGILDHKWKNWSKNRYFKKRVSKPVFKGESIILEKDLVGLETSSNSHSFDLWFRLRGMAYRKSFLYPTKHTSRDRKFEKQGWTQQKSVQLRKDDYNRFYLDILWSKETSEPVQSQDATSLDTGINKLFVDNHGNQYGTELKQKINKLNRKKQGSRNYKRACKEVKDYIGWVTNQLPWDQINTLVLEDLTNITEYTKGRVNKSVRKMLGHWNISLIYRRLQDKAEVSRTFLAFIQPEDTSNKCSSCGAIHRESRYLEDFKCCSCGYSSDADYNAALNILQNFLHGEFTVSRGTARA